MSRMTSAQVIGLGEYLEPNFDPASLTVSQLLGVLGFHDIAYPSPYSKPKLILLFNEQIKGRSAKLKRERLKKTNSIPSDDGITDGLTGKPLTGAQKIPIARRSSRRLSRVPAQEEETSPVRPDPPKRRRSSAQPVLGGPSRKFATVQPTLTEESESEDDILPIRKVGRSKKASEAAGVHGRRVSNTAAEDSGWEDNNIFQSGAESSSPARPSPVRPRVARKSLVPRKSRKSSSAPPQMLPSSPTSSPEQVRNPPPQSNFDPDLPAIVSRDKRRLVAPKFTQTTFTPTEHAKQDSDDELNLLDEVSGAHDAIPEDPFEDFAEGIKENSDGEDPFTDIDRTEDQSIAISRRIAEGGQAAEKRHRVPPAGSKPASVIWRLLGFVVLMVSAGVVINFKMESTSIGYCDASSNSNSVLDNLRSRREAIEACNRENRTLLYLPPLSVDASREGETAGDLAGADLTPCPLPPLTHLFYPNTCTPCPGHATCTQHTINCDVGYLLRPHRLLFLLPPSSSPRKAPLSLSSSPAELAWKLVSEGLDGLPGLGSVALPSRCVEDPKRKRNIGALGKAIDSILAKERGHQLCTKSESTGKPDGGEAKKWGMKLDALKSFMKRKSSPHLLETFDDTFNEAIQQLVQWGGVFIEEDSQHDRYVAHKTPDLTWVCVARVKSREAWAEWKGTVIGAITVLALVLFGRARKAQKQVENKRIADLVQIALDALRQQELAHHTDPVITPHPYLSSLQLRDLILQDEHSVSSRSRLWAQVEHVVEGNANVRANLQEMQGGEEMRVWRWVGSAGPKLETPGRGA